MIQSMTAFASRVGALGDSTWSWELRSVNGRGLDLRVRLPEGFSAIEVAGRAAMKKQINRGTLTLNLRLSQGDQKADLSVDPIQLDAVLRALDTVQDRAFEIGVTLAQPTAADVLMQRGVLVAGQPAEQSDDLAKALQTDLTALIADFVAMRVAEGAALHDIIAGQIDQIADLTVQATAAASARQADVQTNLTVALQRVLHDVADADPDRVAQELAVLAVKSDVTEELDRLRAHVAAARALLASGAPAGRKLDFLAQEFNREANTLCAKAGAPDLTAIGLDLKAVIDQMREQIQNVE
ncbi:MAG: YicC/YloC family endoribonuclease [Yoonia sp.]